MTAAKFSHENPESQCHYDGWKCYEAIEKTLEGCYFTRISAFDFGNVVKYLWRSDRKNGDSDLKKANVYRDKFVSRMKSRLNDEHAKLMIEIFDRKVEEALAMKDNE